MRELLLVGAGDLMTAKAPAVVSVSHLVGGWLDWTTEQYTTWSVISARNHGAEAQRLKTFSDWTNRMWPN